jgi:hypothetical protein
MDSEEWVSLKQMAEELKIPERTLLYYKAQGDFPEVFRFGAKHRRVRRTDFEIWKEKHKEQ